MRLPQNDNRRIAFRICVRLFGHVFSNLRIVFQTGCPLHLGSRPDHRHFLAAHHHLCRHGRAQHEHRVLENRRGSKCEKNNWRRTKRRELENRRNPSRDVIQDTSDVDNRKIDELKRKSNGQISGCGCCDLRKLGFHKS